MLSARWMKVLRDLRLHKGRTALVVLAIAAGLFGAGTVLDKYALVRQAITTGYLASNPPSAILRADRITPAALARVRGLPEVREAEARRTVDGTVRVAGKRHALRLFVADDLAGVRIGRIASERGTWPPAPGGLVVERSSLPLATVDVGDEVDVETAHGTRRILPVVGLVHDVGLAPGWMEHIVYAYATTATLAELGEEPYLDELRFTVADATLDQAGVRHVAAAVTRELEGLGTTVREVSVPVPGEHVHAGQMNSFLYVQLALGLLALALSAALVVQLMTAVLAGQVREIGMMKAVGARTSQVAALYLAMVGLMGLAASAIAVPAAAVAGRAYAEFTTAMLNFDLVDVRLPARVVALQVVVGTLLPLLAAALPVYRGARRTVSAALREDGGADRLTRISRVERLAGRLGSRLANLPRLWLLALRNARRRPGRLAWTLLTLAAGGALYIGSLNLRTSIVGTVATWFDAVRHDVTVALDEPHPAAELERIVGRVPGVLRVEAWGRERAALELPDGTRSNPFSVAAPPADSTFAVYPMTRGRWLSAGEAADDGLAGEAPRELVVNGKWNRQFRPVEVGDAVTLWIDGRAQSFRIVGIIDPSPTRAIAYTRPASLGDDRVATTALIRVDPGNAGLRSHVEMVRRRDAAAGRELSAAERIHGAGALPPDAGPEDARAILADAPRLFEVVLEGAGIGVASSLAVQTARRAMEDHVVLVVDLLAAMSLLVIAVGGFSLATTMSLSVLERVREIGVLRAIGASHRAILVLVVAEALVIAVASWGLAVPGSLPMSYFLGSAFGRIMFQTPMSFSAAPAAAAVWLVLAAGLAAVASLWPAWQATRLTTRQALDAHASPG